MNTLDRMFTRIQSIIGRGRVSFVDDSGPVQMMQVKINDLETGDQRPRLAEYGFSSFPHPGCDVILVFTGGNRSNGAVIGTGDQRYRLHLVEGEVAISDDLGQKVHLTRSGIVIDGGGLPITIQDTPSLTVNATTEVLLNTPLLKVAGDIVATGNIYDQNSTKGTLQHIRDNYDSHTHGNVQAGSGNTGTPNNSL